jgi:hypothetical protein
LLSSLLTTTTYANHQQHELAIVNHFNKSLSFQVGINPEVLPDWSHTFNLAVNENTSSRVLNTGKEAYISVRDNNNDYAFWGVMIANQQTKIFGYLSKGIAFSWTKQAITFCTPEEYHQKGHC